MADEEKIIYVYSDWIEPCSLMGKMYVNYSRGREVTAFEFDDNWLKANNSSICYDPDLSYYSGRQYAPLDKQLFGIFSDSCPDRWGRLLMKRREETYAKKEDRKPKKLTETDYLLGVYDQTRMGGLRFSLSEGGQFLSADKELAAPPWTTLRTLENASIAFENSDDSDNEKWLKQLIAPGSSLGGARPKASVLAPDGSLWIAKFPSKNDDMDVGAWEMVVHDLAELCAINVPPAKIESFSKYGSTFLVKRFDRNGERRIHFSSAMTLLGKKDGDDNVSYLDLVSFIKSNGVSPHKDLEELFKRLVFTVAVSNTDNHLRNHGFLLTERGWELSPMFDVNPNNAGYNLALNIDLNNNDLDIGLALSTAKYYNLPLAKAEKIANDIVGMVNDKWRQLATKYGLNRSQIERIAPAFIGRSK
jgi:serine/threonine-protein kinase HipA